MKTLLVILTCLFSLPSVAANYPQCVNGERSEVCQAYLQGINDAKAATVDTTTVQESTFRQRALEQRGGERVRNLERQQR
ncbi:hypothetical protein UB37_03670 [Photobacterium iliopiscarium]|jgi:hypothetical protein|uniref:DUF1311 domain-containing protein n=1 Tax=Photobacterium iliopiscarium TaxID=56192 RepID=A0A0D8Q2D8_9GAMM|nr:hypothetical protein [Photobacterium iliopiscarium]KJG14409.1 hypothetical protein UB38_03535 [Photobacterium iliopiscarium]KJG25063.1 hypothetical protein UB37_03670 [Photobacterium iliopiscarium]MCD9466992.1 hypothetical protein [Photobacterium iliopiscarium]MCD9486706.1 hypothetical protein [Photobacterium iliopiscarium]MCF2243381.1 hypothetical protein [Photobacterium iliopiscarium]